jgi:hypothetical protein
MMGPQCPARMITSSMLTIRSRPTFKKNPASGKPVSYARICLNSHFHFQKSILTTKPASVIWVTNGSAKLMPQYVGSQPKPIHNSAFSKRMLRKSNTLSLILVRHDSSGFFMLASVQQSL